MAFACISGCPEEPDSPVHSGGVADVPAEGAGAAGVAEPVVAGCVVNRDLMSKPCADAKPPDAKPPKEAASATALTTCKGRRTRVRDRLAISIGSVVAALRLPLAFLWETYIVAVSLTNGPYRRAAFYALHPQIQPTIAATS
jgi:hypothetical protein